MVPLGKLRAWEKWIMKKTWSNISRDTVAFLSDMRKVDSQFSAKLPVATFRWAMSDDENGENFSSRVHFKWKYYN